MSATENQTAVTTAEVSTIAVAIAGKAEMTSLEPHYSPAELAKRWGIAVPRVRAMFRDVPGVLRLHRSRPGKTPRVHLRIPESIAAAVHEGWTAAPQAEIQVRGRSVEQPLR